MNLKILVADDERVAQKVLTTILQRAGYEVVCADDGATALRLLLQRDAPHIAIVDWMMPSLNGPDLCAKLRSVNLRIRPYLIMLSGKAEKSEIAAALDAGADDYLSKPFNQLEFLARLRVAGRIVQAQLELHKYINQLEKRVQTTPPMPLPPVSATTPPLAEPPAAPAGPEPSPASAEKSSRPAAPSKTLPPLDFPAIVLRALSAYDFGAVKAVPAAGPDIAVKAADYTAWASLVVPSHQLWLDFVLTVDAASARAWHNFTLHRMPESFAETLDFVASRHTAIIESLKTSLAGVRSPTLSPLEPYCVHFEQPTPALPSPGGADRRAFHFTDLSVSLEMWIQPCPISWKRPPQLNAGNMLAQDFQPPQQGTGIPLLNQGVALSERYIEKIIKLAESDFPDLSVPVFQPSPLAAWFERLRRREQNS